MRIATLVHQFPKLSETFILSQINGLISEGHDVYICAQEAADEDVRQPVIARNGLMERTRYAANRSDSIVHQLFDALRVIVPLALRDPRLAARALFTTKLIGPSMYLQRIAWAQTLAGVPTPDIIHGQFGTIQHAAMNLQTLCPPSTRLITSFRGRDITALIKENGPEMYRDLFKVGHMFVPCCEALGERLREVGCPPERIRVVYCGIDTDSFTFAPRSWTPGEALRLACVGRFVEKKGFDDAIRAMARVTETVPDASLLIVGDGPLQTEYEHLIDALGLADNVSFSGPVSHDQLSSVLAPCHIFVAPSRIAADGDQEGIANTIKEAMALGIPTVATDHSGTGELVVDGKTGILVPENDPDALAGGILAMVERYESWPQLILAAREAVIADFSDSCCNEVLLAVYDEAMQLPTGGVMPREK